MAVIYVYKVLRIFHNQIKDKLILIKNLFPNLSLILENQYTDIFTQELFVIYTLSEKKNKNYDIYQQNKPHKCSLLPTLQQTNSTYNKNDLRILGAR